jgi:hypothetical protein
LASPSLASLRDSSLVKLPSDQTVDERPVLQVGQLRGELERVLPRRQVSADFQRPRLRVEAVKDVVAQIDSFDADIVHRRQPVGQIAHQIGAVHSHRHRELLGCRVQLVQVVLPLVEVVAHLFVRHGDRPAAAPVGETVLGGGRQLRGREPVPPVQIDQSPRQRRVRAHDVSQLGLVYLDTEVVVERDLA